MKTNRKRDEAMHLQAIEGNPFDAEDTALFDSFDREGLTPEDRRARILTQAKAMAPAAE